MVVAVIPARYNSKRYPGKLLVEIKGKPIIQHVYESAQKAVFLDDVIIATDHHKIIQSCNAFNGKVFLTSKNHFNGTSRCLEAIQKLYPNYEDNSIIINIQGDQLSVKTEQLSKLISCFRKEEVEIATLKKRITASKKILSNNIVKVETDIDKNAVHFYRKFIGKNVLLMYLDD